MDRLWQDSEWSMDAIKRTYDAIEEIGVNELGLDIYPNQIEIIGTEQMIDAYTSIGMPLMYKHWSFGKRFVQEWESYRKGRSGLAYELVINSNPCINYLMEDNSMTIQALVLAHAACGHNHFFKNNYLFQQWTDAEGIVDYLKYARDYVERTEARYGEDEVATFLDSCHALMDYGVNRYKRKKVRLDVLREREKLKQEYEQSRVSDLDRIAPRQEIRRRVLDADDIKDADQFPPHPEENILYFCEKYGNLKTWQRELIRIVRKISQYFYPQSQTKVMNEGFASLVHYKIMHRLHEKGLVSDGTHLEFLATHTNVINQYGISSPYYSGFNPYKLGFEMLTDIERMCTNPTDEDRHWFPDLPGQDPWEAVKYACANFRDESFIHQYLSPKIIRDFSMFHVYDDKTEDHYMVKSIHDESGYKAIRQKLAEQYEWDTHVPNLEVTRWDRQTNCLTIVHKDRRGRQLNLDNEDEMRLHLEAIWGNDVEVIDQNEGTDPVKDPDQLELFKV